MDLAQLLDIELCLAVRDFCRGHLATQIGEDLVLGAGQRGGLLHDAGATAVMHGIQGVALAGLEHQLAVGHAELTLHAGQAGRGGCLGRTLEQLAAGKQREQGDKHQGTGSTHRWVSRQVPPRYAGKPLITRLGALSDVKCLAGLQAFHALGVGQRHVGRRRAVELHAALGECLAQQYLNFGICAPKIGGRTPLDRSKKRWIETERESLFGRSRHVADLAVQCTGVDHGLRVALTA